MDEVQEFCRRVLGPGSLADEAAAQAGAEQHEDRVGRLSAAARACRERADRAAERPERAGQGSRGLAGAVAEELALATAKLPERQREALALRELLRFSHEQIGRVMEIEPAAVALLLARARLRLRSERRGVPSERGPVCNDRDRALRLLARRHDSEPLSTEDDVWLLEHLGECEECGRAHGAMLEASVCYRAWRPGAPRIAASPSSE